MASHRRPPEDHPGLRGVQGAQLHHQEEPAERPGPPRAEEVLPALPARTPRTARPADSGARRVAAHRGRPASGSGLVWSCHGPARRQPHRAPRSASDARWRSTPISSDGPTRPRALRGGREKIREFAEAVGDPNPVYRDRDAARRRATPTSIAPPTFADHRRSRREAGSSTPRLGLDYSRVVHGDQRFTLHTARSWPGTGWCRRPRSTTVKSRRQRDASTSRRDRHRGRRAGRDRPLVDAASSGARGRAAHDGHVRYDDVEVGDELPARRIPVHARRPRPVRRRQRRLQPDPLERAGRRAVGLPDVIAHGMFTMASAGRVVTDWAGDPGAVVEYGVRFTKPVVVRTTTAAPSRSPARSPAKDERRAPSGSTSTATCGGEKVLGLPKAVLPCLSGPPCCSPTTPRCGSAALPAGRARHHRRRDRRRPRAPTRPASRCWCSPAARNLVVGDDGFDGTVVQGRHPRRRRSTRRRLRRASGSRWPRASPGTTSWPRGRAAAGSGSRRCPGIPGSRRRDPGPERRRLRPGGRRDDRHGPRLGPQSSAGSAHLRRRRLRLRLPHQPLQGATPGRYVVLDGHLPAPARATSARRCAYAELARDARRRARATGRR